MCTSDKKQFYRLRAWFENLFVSPALPLMCAFKKQCVHPREGFEGDIAAWQEVKETAGVSFQVLPNADV